MIELPPQLDETLFVLPIRFCRMQFLRYLKEFLQLTYKVVCKEEELKPFPEEESGCGDAVLGGRGEVLSRLAVILSCVGVGYSNINRAIK